jgi:hypothetical protein
MRSMCRILTGTTMYIRIIRCKVEHFFRVTSMTFNVGLGLGGGSIGRPTSPELIRKQLPQASLLQ